MDYDDEEIDYDDLRAVEISTLKAIFPELVVDSDDKYAFMLEVPVNPAEAVTVAFPATGIIENATTPTPAVPGTSSAAADAGAGGGNVHFHPENRVIDTHDLAYLPSLHLQVTLPPAYPAEEPPSVSVTAVPPWLPSPVLTRLEGDCGRLWEEMGHDQVVFSYVDHIQQAADDKVFGLVNKNGFLAVDTEHKVAILNYDVAAKQAAFAKETFGCGICLDPKKGAACHRMQDCGHVFCRQCLQDFYSSAITEGDLASVRCLEPNCSKERSAATHQAGKRNSKPKLVSVSPGELLQIPIDETLVKRYIDLKYKTALESDKNTVYCPRAWCNGAARSNKHKKPQGFSLHESDEEDQEEAAAASGGDDGKGKKTFSASEERLCICDDCGFAFCSRCLLSWHGDFVYCSPPRNTGELAEEDKASLEYLAHHTTPCPTCAAPAQKTMGCNHMICFRCNTHFCYLCSAWLDSSNPYRHFGEAPDGRRTGCFNRLWELQDGDEGGGDGQIFAFHGGVAIDIADLNELGSDGEPDDEDWGSEDEGVPDLDPIDEWVEDNEPEVGPAQDANNVNGAPAARGGRGGRGGRQNQRGADQRGGRGGGGQNARRIERARRGAAAPAVHQHIDVAREGPLVLRIAMEPAPARAAARPVAPVPNNNNHNNNNGVAQRGWEGAAAGRGRGGDGRVRGGFGRARGGAGRGGGQGRGDGGGGGGGGQQDPGNELDPAMAAWVRNFVELALVDNEDAED